jgi:hypothetical protein
MWHCKVILLYDIIHNMTFYSDQHVRHYIHNMTFYSDQNVRLYIQNMTFCFGQNVQHYIHNMTFYSNPTIRRYTQYGIAQCSYYTTLCSMSCWKRPSVINKQKTKLNFTKNSAYPKIKQNNEVRDLSKNFIYIIYIYIVFTSLNSKNNTVDSPVEGTMSVAGVNIALAS